MFWKNVQLRKWKRKKCCLCVCVCEGDGEICATFSPHLEDRDDWWWKLQLFTPTHTQHLLCVRRKRTEFPYIYFQRFYLISDDDVTFFKLTVRITQWATAKNIFLRLWCLWVKSFPSLVLQWNCRFCTTSTNIGK